MARTSAGAAGLLAAAQAGDEGAFERLIEPERARLHAHCYRMLASLHDADDALQETLVRAWRGLGGFDGRSALGTWLYRIATNTCLNAIKKRSRRVLPVDFGAGSTDPSAAVTPPLAESAWVEAYPDELLAATDEATAPSASYERRESLELAFVAALQHLPANGRAALIMSEVLGFSAQEIASTLETSTASVNSALQRARKQVDASLPDRTQQAALRAVGDPELNAAVERYMQAMEEADVDGLVSMLSADATWSMPPQAAWFQGRAAIAAFASENPFKHFRWRLLRTRANGQEATACYSWDEPRDLWIPHALNVLSFGDGGEITEIVSFLDVTRRGVTGPGFSSFYETRIFERFGVPNELAA